MKAKTIDLEDIKQFHSKAFTVNSERDSERICGFCKVNLVKTNNKVMGLVIFNDLGKNRPTCENCSKILKERGVPDIADGL